MTTDIDVKLDEILVAFFNEAEPDVHATNGGTVYTYAGTQVLVPQHAKQAIKQLIADYITIQTAKARFSELTQIGSLINGSRKAYFDHYEYRYKFLKNIIESAETTPKEGV